MRYVWGKTLFSSMIFGLLFLFPTFGITVHLPSDHHNNDVNIKSNTQDSTKVLGMEVSYYNRNTVVKGDESTLNATINRINEYLWWSFGFFAFGLTVYAGYEAITAWGDKKALKKAMRTLIGVAVGVAIAMLSAALVKIVVNLFSTGG